MEEESDDTKFWLCVAKAKAYKPGRGKSIKQDEMCIQWNQWAVDVVWFTSLGGGRYKKTSASVCTVPLNTCIDCPGLKWASESGNVGTLSEASIQMICKEWVSATKT